MKATETYYENKIKKLEEKLEEIRTTAEHLISIGKDGISSTNNANVKFGWQMHVVLGKDLLDILGEENASI